MARDVVAEIRRAMRRKFRAEDKIPIVLEGLWGEIPVPQVCRHESICRLCTIGGLRLLCFPGKKGYYYGSDISPRMKG